MAKIKVAVIGCGSIANAAHLPNYAKNAHVELKYCCDSIPERADSAAKAFGGKAVYDYHEILGDPALDAVSVCTHNDMHAPISIDFLRAGKDVLCEKPAARTLPEALEMQKAAAETGKLLIIGVVNRFGAYNNLLKKMIARGDLGEVYHVFASFRAHRSIPGIGGDFTRKAVSGGGALIDWGVHYLDLILYCTGEPKPIAASGAAFCKLGRDIKAYTYLSMWADRTKEEGGVFDVDDSVTGLVRTTGPVVSFQGAWAQNIGESETFIDFLGTKGGARLQYFDKSLVCYTAQDGALARQKIELPPCDPYGAEIDSFVQSILTRTPNQACINNAVATSKIMDAIYRSSDEGREVTIA
ncbi:MAG: Gfo/Idh/MocA family oxidoreductase [Oscillospiraceae bacterium]|jgi:predicted dehydrogenase|nr:Gfo/Idh/MocA family oxidoreductase [Oscillospiraceae bacterium]